MIGEDDMLPAITRGTRLTNQLNFDLTLEGSATGGMGLVVWGPDAASNGKWRAAKLLKPQVIASATAEQRQRLQVAFEHEALIWCHLWPHPFIITARDLIRLPGWNHLPVLVLEYARLGSLRTLLQSARRVGNAVKLDMALAWAQQIAAALGAIHQPDPDHERNTLVHCDLKPENVLIAGNGTAKLTDLGLTRVWTAATTATHQVNIIPNNTSATTHIDTPTSRHDYEHDSGLTRSVRVAPQAGLPLIGTAGPVVGTLPYMPPEQWRGIDAIVPASDVYALGVLLFELFAGVDGFPHSPHLLGMSSQDMQQAWYAAHLAGPSHHLTDPEVQALTQGPLQGLADLLRVRDPRASDAAVRSLAQDVLTQLDTLIRVCLAQSPEARPSAMQVQMHLGVLVERLGEQRQQVQEKAPHTPQNEAIFWNTMAATYGSIGKPEEQLRLCRKALDLDPHNATRWDSLASVLIDLKRYEEALSTLDEAEARLTPQQHDDSTVPQHILTWLISGRRGIIYGRMGRYADAIAAFERVLAQQPTNGVAWHNLAHNYKQWAVEAHQQPKEQLRRLRKAQEAIAQAHAHGMLGTKTTQLAQGIAAELAQVERDQRSDLST